MKFIVIYLLILSSSLKAQTQPTIAIDPKKMDSAPTKYEPYVPAYTERKPEPPPRKIPAMEQLFKNVPQVKNWPVEKKRKFYSDLGVSSLQELKTQYPEFTIKELANLMDQL